VLRDLPRGGRELPDMDGDNAIGAIETILQSRPQRRRLHKICETDDPRWIVP
jgi:hypothetical protein